MYHEIQYGCLYEQIVDQIEGRILSGELKPGDKLPPERELAKQFRVSRTVMREAMKALTIKGLVEIHPGRGTLVTDTTSSAVRHSIDLLVRIGSVDGIKDLVEVREILEPEIAALAAKRATEEQVDSMIETVELMDWSLDDPITFIKADMDFHLALAQTTNNALVPALLDSLVDLLREHRHKAATVEGGLTRGEAIHKQIIQAIKNKDSEAAREAMRQHLIQIQKEIETAIS